MQINLDLPTLVIVLLVVAGSAWLAGYLSGRGEKEQTQRERVQLRRARRYEVETTNPGPCVLGTCDEPRVAASGLCARHEDAFALRHRAEPDDPETIDTTVDEDTAEVPAVTARQRFAGLAAGSNTPAAPRTLDPDWRKSFDGIAEALRGQTDPMDWATPLFHATGAALLGPTGTYPVLGTTPANPWDKPQPSNPAPRPKTLNKHAKSRKRHAHGGVR